MIEAVKEIGEYSLEKAGRRLEDPTDIVIEDPATNNTYKHILGIKINKTEKGFEYAGIELEEYSKSKIKQYLYKQGDPNGTDLTPTSRVTEIDKTFANKIIKWFTKIIEKNNNSFNAEEIIFLKGIEDCLKSNNTIILSDLKLKYGSLDKKENKITTLLIYSPDKKYIGDFPVFRKVLIEDTSNGYYQKYGKESKAIEKFCSVCRKKSEEVFGFVGTFDYTVDKPGFVSGGFNQSLAWKNYPVCLKCALTLEEGKKYIHENSNFKFYGFNYYIIPKLLNQNKAEEIYKILEEFKEKDPKFETKYIHLLDDNEKEILNKLAEQDNFFNNNLLIYRIDKSAFRILLYIEDILPSRLRILFKAKENVDKKSIFKVLKDGKSMEFNFGNIFSFFPKSNFLEITNKIFTNKKIDYSFLILAIMRKIRIEFQDEKKFTKYLTLKGFQLLIYLNELELLDNFNGGKNMNEKSITNLLQGTNLPLEEKANTLFKEFPDFFNKDSKKAIFLEGVLTQYLLNIQYNDRKATPFRVKLQGLKLDEKHVKKLLPEIQNKLEEYGKNYYKGLEFLIGKYMVQSGEGWKMSNDEISFYFVLGMNLSNLFKSTTEETT
ncbi:TIGR02556 family CRISPR-associated protein [Candidatus Methanoperedens nitratireducens]|uniref:CRISPR-associated protein, Csh1 family n=1 Tax=Candidatus Methanoperedens nitratireducens TaxID=1392998 RepID=A0A284VTL7_9EURY|nr:TIGR02556 family CRISPR-associated protein [Candidatus Methanoperedens nitroreducens]SNQ62612.1 CRISPR-associated protein, Csh1 family [Candidatus Methanoperedens nitroreducens]